MKVSAARYLIDAGPLVGALSAADQWHNWSTDVIATLDEPVFTTETVFAEACHLLRSEKPAIQALIRQVSERRLNLIPIWESDGARAAALLAKYDFMDAGDASLVVLSEKFPRAKIITTDVRHFTVYRRSRDVTLPLIHP
ncbi:MAG: PIN domain-containing protein [Opitutaceae bacterium]|nr:PIN domain-containing protein [Opitutaceae bacterium]